MSYYDIPLKEYLDKELSKKETRKKRTPQIYFTQDTEDAIMEYVLSTDQVFRDKIYKERIQFAFYKLSENIIHTFKFYYTDLNSFEDLKQVVITFLLSKLPLYNQEKGKAYSYFGTIAKRYLIMYNQNNYAKLQNQTTTEEIDNENTIVSHNLTTNTNDEFDNVPFIDLFIQYIDNNLYKLFPKPKDHKTVDIIVQLFKNRENLEILDKKALYIYIREMGNIPTTQITRINKKLKVIYTKLYNEYYFHGHLISS